MSILETVYSVNNVPIRLTDERWDHILERRPYMSSYYDAMLDAVEEPTYILRGYTGTLVAVVVLGRAKYLYVTYRENTASDGFIITAGIKAKLDKSKTIWRAEDQ